MVESNIETSREKVKSLLKELFQFDTQDLDFGIYRIMNFKRKEIERFIDEDLIAAAEAEFKEYAKSGMVDLQKEVDKLRAEIVRDFGEGTIDEQGKVLRDRDAPKIREYLGKVSELESAKVSQSQIEDVFNHIYEFFSRYYDKGDFLSKRRYGGREKYYVPYNGEEVLLNWANNDQYYVKTGEYFKKYSFKAGGYRINFALKEADVEQNNVKVGPKYFVLPEDGDLFELDEKKKELTVFFMWRELVDEEKEKYGTRDVQKAIVLDIANKLSSKIGDKGPGTELRKKSDGETTILEKNLSIYVERNTADYFVHKNLKFFLERELDFYLKNEVLDLDEIEKMDEKYIRTNKAKIRAIEEISKKIIDFLAQIENFQKMLFEKKKFVLRTDYCITLDKVPEGFYDEIGKNEEQIREWRELYSLDEITKDTLDSTKGKAALSVDFLMSHKSLMLDTAHFKQEFKEKLLASFDNVDEVTDGLVIKSENFQALNLLSSAYSGKIKCIYIDPPYNTGSDGFLYKDNYQHSTWLSMMNDRLTLAKKLLRETGLIFISIDENEIHHLKCLLDYLFGSNLESIIAWRRRHNQPNDPTKMIAKVAEYILVYALNSERLKQERAFYGIPLSERRSKQYKNPDNDPRGPWESKPWKAGSGQSGSRYRIISPTGRVFDEEWLGSEETYKRLLTEEVIYFPKKGDGLPRKKYYLDERQIKGQSPHNFWIHDEYGSNQEASSELENLFGKPNIYSNPKPSRLIDAIAKIATNGSEIIVDFFAGSGTTGHSVIGLNNRDAQRRKFVLVEMADCLETVLIPRLKKVAFSGKWKKGVPLSKNGYSLMFKHIRLEQYEDTLNNIVFRETDKSIQETLESFDDYFLRYMLDYGTRESPTRLSIEKFQTPFDYKIKTITENEEKEQTVDLVESFNYLLGLHVQKLRTLKDGENTYRVVFGKGNNENIIIIWRNTKDIDLQSDKKFIEENVLSGHTPDTIFINGDSYIKNAKAIEPEFKRLMGA